MSELDETWNLETVGAALAISWALLVAFVAICLPKLAPDLVNRVGMKIDRWSYED